MPKKDSSYYERRLKRMQKKIDSATELRHEQQAQVVKYKDQTKALLEQQIRIARLAGDEVMKLKETTVSNAMTIRELNDQLAVQWKQRAEAQSDVRQAQETASRAAGAHNRQVQLIQELRGEVKQVTVDRESALALLAEARLSLQYRLWHEANAWISRCKLSVKCRLTRTKNRWLVWRLNKPRVDAMNEGGYIPENLIHMAHKYWEQDKKRMGGTIEEWGAGFRADQQHIVHQTLWRRFRIWCGRA